MLGQFLHISFYFSYKKAKYIVIEIITKYETNMFFECACSIDEVLAAFWVGVLWKAEGSEAYSRSH